MFSFEEGGVAWKLTEATQKKIGEILRSVAKKVDPKNEPKSVAYVVDTAEVMKRFDADLDLLKVDIDQNSEDYIARLNASLRVATYPQMYLSPPAMIKLTGLGS